MSQSSSESDMLVDAFFNVIHELYAEDTKNLCYGNKALYENTFVKDKKLRVRVRKYNKEQIHSEIGYYFLNNLHYTNRVIKHGLATVYYRNGQIEKEYYYFHGKIHGPMLIYGSSGNLLCKLMYDDGLIHGKYYDYERGQLSKEMNYSHGVLHGEYKFYYDGLLCEHSHYIDGKKHGESREWYNGYIVKHERYKNDVLHGTNRYYTFDSFKDTNELCTIIDYVDGKKHGLRKRYTPEGYLEKQEHYHEDKLHGLVTDWGFKYEYHDSDNPSKVYIQRQDNYEHGELHGVCRTFYENGRIRSETKYEHGVKVSNI